MNAEQLLKHFDRISEAPGAVPRLRRFILDLAVRGKLVEQDSAEGTAADVLAQIREGYPRSVSAEPSHHPWPIPPSWRWVRFGDIAISRDGERIPVSKEERARRAKIYDYYGASGVIDKIDDYLFDKPLLLIGEDGANLLNRNTPIAFMAQGKYWVNNHAHVIDAYCDTLLRFLEVHINAIDLRPYVTGAAQPKMNQAKMNGIPIALPPIVEQLRIVTKVNELMALCDRLEAAQADRERRRAGVVLSSLKNIGLSAANGSLVETASFHLKNLPRLTDSVAEVNELRRVILDLAVRGHLVRQEQSDTKSSELVEALRAERMRLVTERELKPSEDDELIDVCELSFVVPQHWAVLRLGSIVRKLGAGSTPLGGKAIYAEDGVPFLRSQNVHNNGLRLSDVARIPRSVHDRMVGTHVQPLDILLNITGASIGRCALVPPDFVEGNVSQHVAIVRLLLPSIRHFAHLSLISPFFQRLIDDVQVGVSREGLSMQRLRRFAMPLPPLDEQRRIVAKVNALMALCDRLTSAQVERDTGRRRLLEAVLQKVLSAA